MSKFDSPEVAVAIARALAASWDYRRKDIAWNDLAQAAITAMLKTASVTEEQLATDALEAEDTFKKSLAGYGVLPLFTDGYKDAYRDLGLIRDNRSTTTPAESEKK